MNEVNTAYVELPLFKRIRKWYIVRQDIQTFWNTHYRHVSNRHKWMLIDPNLKSMSDVQVKRCSLITLHPRRLVYYIIHIITLEDEVVQLATATAYNHVFKELSKPGIKNLNETTTKILELFDKVYPFILDTIENKYLSSIYANGGVHKNKFHTDQFFGMMAIDYSQPNGIVIDIVLDTSGEDITPVMITEIVEHFIKQNCEPI